MSEKGQPSLLRHSPLYDFLSPFRPAPNQWVARYIIILFAVIIRCAVGLGSYSGMNTAPMFGDFEAQRHWMEVTIAKPLNQWYYFDLQYWGLDYPPLTAFHSWCLGKLGSFIEPSWFALGTSRGMESNDLKAFMRFSAIASELMVYIPGVIAFTRFMGKRMYTKSPIEQTIIAAAILFQPSLMIIDHGHFQYNSVMLGLALVSFVNLMYDNYALASIFFVLSISFKQMTLYYAPLMFFYLLSKSVKEGNVVRVIVIGTSILTTLAALLIPFIFSGGVGEVLQILHRMFPFERGIFEDKVGNFWCATNTFVKYRNIFDDKSLQRLSLMLTLIGMMPSCLTIFFKPEKRLLPWGFSACAWSFYLFSFQVHEKSVLVPLMPATLLYCDSDPNVLTMVSWINNMALFSMWPLLKRDGLTLQYVMLAILSNWLMGNLNWISKYLLPTKITPSPMLVEKASKTETKTAIHTHWFWRLVFISTYVCAFGLHAVECVFSSQRYPDLWVVANVTLSFVCFTIFWTWCNYKMVVCVL